MNYKAYPVYPYITFLMDLIIDDNGRFKGEEILNLKKNKKNEDKSPKEKTNVQLTEQGVPVLVDPVLIKNQMADVDLDQRDFTIDGINGIDFVQTKDENMTPQDVTVLQVNGESRRVIQDQDDLFIQLSNPVVNPPFNNWSVNQPSPPHNHGMQGTEDLGMRHIILDGVDYNFVQQK